MAEIEPILLHMQVNSRRVSERVEPRTLLVEVLRTTLGLTGTHIGCDTSYCGACTVLLDGQPVKSCTVLAAQAQGRSVRTVEGLSSEEGLHPLQSCFSQHHALQCGYCTPGFLMAAVALLEAGEPVDEAAVKKAVAGNTCRCTGYQNIVAAILDAASRAGLRTTHEA